MICLLLLLWSPAQAGLFNLDEIENVEYSVDILDSPVSYGDQGELLSENAITMVNKFGQKYHCELPVQENPGEEGSGLNPDTPVDVRELLAPLYNPKHCLIRTKDWWTYSVCFGDRITQYHMEQEKPVGVVMNLGVKNHDREDEDLDKLSYYPEWYTNGTKCDLTGQGRETELRFVCNEQASLEFIGDIFEPKSCEYVIVIHTDKICGVPNLKPTTESVPLGINCKPILPYEQVEKYQEYAKLKTRKAELKLKQVKAQQQQFLNLLNGKPDTSAGGVGNGAMDKLMKELGSFVDSALAGAGGKESVKIVAMHEPVANPPTPTQKDEDPDIVRIKKELKEDGESIAKLEEKWNLIKRKKDLTTDRRTILLKEERNAVWEKIHENKHLIKKFSSQLKDTETFLQNNLEKELKYDAGIIEKLEIQKKQLEKAIEKARSTLLDLEVEEKIVKRRLDVHIIALQQAGERFSSLYEELKLLRLAELEDPEQYHGVLAKVMQHYAMLTGAKLLKFSDWFDMARHHVLFDQAFLETRKFYMFADGEIPEINEKHGLDISQPTQKIEDIIENDIENLMKQIRENEVSLGPQGQVSLDEVKENVKGEFSNILKEAMDELNIDDLELDKVDESMDLMEGELDKLMEKLKGAEDVVDSSIRNLEKGGKHDGKKSVKKELREDADLTQTEKSQNTLKETKRKLQEIETELDQVEVGLKEKKKQLKVETEKVEVEFKKITENGLETLDGEGSQQLAKKIESSLKDRLGKLGIDKNKPIEIKVITTSIPLAGEDLEGIAGSQYDGMVHNLMHGNQQGYQDIDSQRLAEKNYKFAWDDSMMEKLNKELEGLEDTPKANPDVASTLDSQIDQETLEQQAEKTLEDQVKETLENLKNRNMDEPGLDPDLFEIVKNNVGELADDLGIEFAESDLDEALSLVSEMFGVGEERTRPSSRDTSTDVVDDVADIVNDEKNVESLEQTNDKVRPVDGETPSDGEDVEMPEQSRDEL